MQHLARVPALVAFLGHAQDGGNTFTLLTDGRSQAVASQLTGCNKQLCQVGIKARGQKRCPGESLNTVLGQGACSQKDLKTWFASVSSGVSSNEAVSEKRPEEVALGLHTLREDGSGTLSR